MNTIWLSSKYIDNKKMKLTLDWGSLFEYSVQYAAK